MPYVLPTSLDDPNQGAACDRYALLVILRDALTRTRLWGVLELQLAPGQTSARSTAQRPGCPCSCRKTRARRSTWALSRFWRCARDPPAWLRDQSG